MVYIEMPAEEKRQGKAAVDLVGSQARGRAYALSYLVISSSIVSQGGSGEKVAERPQLGTRPRATRCQAT